MIFVSGPTCPDPGTFAGTQQVATSYEEFSYVSYTCERTGFSPMSNLPLYCQYDPNTGGLAWNGTAQNCTGVCVSVRVCVCVCVSFVCV